MNRLDQRRPFQTVAGGFSPAPAQCQRIHIPPTISTLASADFGDERTHTLWAFLGCMADGFSWMMPVILLLMAGHLIALL